MKQYNKPRKSHALFGLRFVETIPSSRLGFLRGVFRANQSWQVQITQPEQPKDRTYRNEN